MQCKRQEDQKRKFIKKLDDYNKELHKENLELKDDVREYKWTIATCIVCIVFQALVLVLR